MTSNKSYHLKDNWEEKYRISCDKIEWIQSAEEAFSKIKPLLPQDKDSQILELGCGTSVLCQLFNHDGYDKITCLDFSKRLIKARTPKNSSQTLFVCADFTEPFQFEPQTQYDVIIDKGSIDCIFCEEDSLRKVLTCVLNCYNRLKVGGKLISFSLGLPKNRKYWFQNKLAPFELEIMKHVNRQKEGMRKNVKGYEKTKEENSEDYYIYVCTKVSENSNNQEEDQNNMENIDLNEDNMENADNAYLGQEEVEKQDPIESQKEEDPNQMAEQNDLENHQGEDEKNQNEIQLQNEHEQNQEDSQYQDQFNQNDQHDEIQ